MAFIDLSFPQWAAQYASPSLRFDTNVLGLKSGYELRTPTKQGIRTIYEMNLPDMIATDFHLVYNLIKIANGLEKSFRFKDFFDYQLTQQPLNNTINLTTYQITKKYTSDDQTITRKITKPAKNVALNIFKNGTLADRATYNINYNTGIITFNTPNSPQDILEITCEFDTEVRIESPKVAYKLTANRMFRIEQFNIISLD